MKELGVMMLDVMDTGNNALIILLLLIYLLLLNRKMAYNNGDVYEGNWQNEKHNGFGIFFTYPISPLAHIV